MTESYGSGPRVFSGTLEVKQWTLFKDLHQHKYCRSEYAQLCFDYEHMLVALSKPYACQWFTQQFYNEPTYLEDKSGHFNKDTGRWEKNLIIFSGSLEELTNNHLKYILLDEKALFLDGKHQLYEKVIRKIVTLYDDKEQRKLLVVPRADINL